MSRYQKYGYQKRGFNDKAIPKLWCQATSKEEGIKINMTTDKCGALSEYLETKLPIC